ncbi:MAG: cytochrome c [Acidimicrobiales bacterium]|nr:cytochrome c [Acidimicrobiales bacterium]
MPTPPLLRRLTPLVLVLVLSAACSSDPPEVPLGPGGEPDPVLALGRDVYGARCVNCHGSTGGGGTGPRLAGTVVEGYPDVADQIAVVGDGVRNMPSFTGTLTPEAIEAVVRYTREVLG